MNHDISQSVPQRGDGAQDAENIRIAAIADELERLCAVHEAQLGDSQSYVSRFEAEQRAAEQMAKANSFWIPMMDVFGLGIPGPSGNENDTYVAEKVIYKVNNLLNRKVLWTDGLTSSTSTGRCWTRYRIWQTR